MNRRQLLSRSVVAVSVPLAGCAVGNVEDGAGTETPAPDGTEPGCWPSMCEGTQIVDVHVDPGFSGTAVLGVGCRDEELTIQPGESVRIVREDDGEECGVTLYLDGEKGYGEYVEGYVSVTVTVDSDGDVDDESVML